MKTIIFVCLCVVAALGLPLEERPPEVGRLEPSADGSAHEGEITFVGDDGKTYVTKIQDLRHRREVQGDHLPKPVEAELVPEVPKVEETAVSSA